MAKKTIIYDSMNRLVWVEGQKKTKGTDGTYGKDAKRFKSNTQSRAYALKLAREKGGKVYDKYYGKYITKTKKRKSSGGFDPFKSFSGFSGRY